MTERDIPPEAAAATSEASSPAVGPELAALRRKRRLVAYPLSAAVLAVLLWLGFLRQVDADPGMLLQTAAIHYELAARLGDVPEGQRLRGEGDDLLERALQAGAPGWEIARVRAQDAFMSGHLDRAIAELAAARGDADCPPSAQPELALGQAELSLRAGRPADARAVLDDDTVLWGDSTMPARQVLRVRALHALGEGDAARVVADDLSARRLVDRSQVGLLYEEIGAVDAAAETFEGAVRDEPITNYYLARLKLRQGDVDSALRLLEAAFARADADTRVSLRQDEAEWVAGAGERFQQAMGNRPEPDTVPVAPGR